MAILSRETFLRLRSAIFQHIQNGQPANFLTDQRHPARAGAVSPVDPDPDDNALPVQFFRRLNVPVHAPFQQGFANIFGVNWCSPSWIRDVNAKSHNVRRWWVANFLPKSAVRIRITLGGASSRVFSSAFWALGVAS